MGRIALAATVARARKVRVDVGDETPRHVSDPRRFRLVVQRGVVIELAVCIRQERGHRRSERLAAAEGVRLYVAGVEHLDDLDFTERVERRVGERERSDAALDESVGS
jgi:hypothetical protein